MPEICCQGKKKKCYTINVLKTKIDRATKPHALPQRVIATLLHALPQRVIATLLHALPQRVIATLPIDTRRLRRASTAAYSREERHLSKKGATGSPVRARGRTGPQGLHVPVCKSVLPYTPCPVSHVPPINSSEPDLKFSILSSKPHVQQ